jgi:methyl-accepting chemotaxis protein
VEKVGSGTKLVEQAGATMHEVVDSVRRVTDIVGAISAATDEQNAGIAQVHQAITQMDQVTQQNAALVEETAAAAQLLREQADELAQAVAAFTIDAGLARPAGRPARLAPVKVAPVRSRNMVPVAKKPARSKPLASPSATPAAVGDGWEEF